MLGGVDAAGHVPGGGHQQRRGADMGRDAVQEDTEHGGAQDEGGDAGVVVVHAVVGLAGQEHLAEGRSSPEHYTSKLSGHKSEVCGLKWSYDDRELASGGNDNQLYVWSANSTHPLLRYSDHTAAVKAIAWSPHQHGLLASGGGTADRCIRFWNTTTNTPLSCIDTGSQVCNLVWSKNVNELVSTHGYSQNQIIVWRYPNMSKLATLTGHTLRVLYLAISPDGQTVVTGAGDETLRFWNVFPGPKSQGSVHDNSVWSMGRTHIR